MPKEINVGMVAFGMSGRYFHAPFIDAYPNLHLKKVVERHAEESKERYPYVEVVRTLDALLSDDSIRIVVITSPNLLHHRMAKKSIEAGKHVVVEKPFTVSAEEADELIQYAENQNLLLTVYQNRRWDGDFQTIQKIIRKKVLGQLTEYESHFDRYRTYVKPDSYKEEDQPGSGILYDLGPHLLDQALVLFGKPISITGDIRRQREFTKVDDYFEIDLEYENLKVILKAGMIVREKGPHFILHGQGGSFVKYGMDPQEEALFNGKSPLVDGWGVEPELYWGTLNTDINGLHFRGKIETQSGSYAMFYTQLYNAVVYGNAVPVNPADARNVIRLIELVEESNREQKTITLDGNELI